MKKKIFTFFLALVAGVGTMFAWDVERVQIGDLYYNLNHTSRMAEVTYRSYSSSTYNEGWDVTTANIPASVKYINITYSVTRIGESAFRDCSSLTSVTIPNSVTYIGDRAFYGCSGLTSMTIPNSVTYIGLWAFTGCSGLTSPVYNAHFFAYMPTSFSGAYTIPNGIEYIASCAFAYCTGLTSVTIPNSVTYIGKWAFDECSGLTSVTIPNSVTSIGDRAFYECSGLTSVTIGNSVKSIGVGAFSGCSSLTSVTIPNSVTSIGEYAFAGCTGLTSVTIGNSVTSIGNYAFNNCTGLTSVTIKAETPPTLVVGWDDEYVFGNTNNCPIYVPCNAVNTYKTKWKSYTDRIRGNCASSYTVRFLNWDGSVLQSMQVEEGQIPQYTGATPTKPSDAQYFYTFSGWTPQIVAATADATYTATYTATPRSQGIEDVLSDQVQCTKFLRGGQIFILRGEKVYSITGQEVK